MFVRLPPPRRTARRGTTLHERGSRGSRCLARALPWAVAALQQSELGNLIRRRHQQSSQAARRHSPTSTAQSRPELGMDWDPFIAKSLGMEATTPPAVSEIKATNKTSFDDAGDKAVLGVTSGLDMPTKPLPCIPSVEMIERRAAPRQASRGASRDSQRLELLCHGTRQAMTVRTFVAVHAGKGDAAGAAPQTGLVDAGGKYSCSAGEVMLAQGHEHGFIAAVTAAFKDHYPLALRPQHFWLMVAQGVATHVDLNAEAVRASWVRHEGKKTLAVRAQSPESSAFPYCALPAQVSASAVVDRFGATSL
eukprot:SAG31_NODE_4471_length_3205_cov_2.753059_1_plen_307_part_00